MAESITLPGNMAKRRVRFARRSPGYVTTPAAREFGWISSPMNRAPPCSPASSSLGRSPQNCILDQV